MKCNVLCLLLFFLCCSCSVKYLPPAEEGKDPEVTALINHYSQNSSLDSLSAQLWSRSAEYLFYYMKEEESSRKWDEFYALSLENNHTVERNIMDVFDKTLYLQLLPLHWDTKYPDDTPSLTKTAQVSFVNILFQNEVSYNDRELLVPLIEEYSEAVLHTLIPSPEERDQFRTKLSIMNQGYINLSLVSSSRVIKSQELDEYTAYARSCYNINAFNYRFDTYVNSRYLTPLSSFTFLHEMTHAILSIHQMPLELFEIDRNNDSAVTIINNINFEQNRMLNEGLAEYITRKKSLFGQLPLFEPVHSEVLYYRTNKDHPLLSLDEMDSYYYGEEGWRNGQITYGLTSAHSLVDYLVTNYSIEKVIELIYCQNIETDAETILGTSWESVIEEWHSVVLKAG